MSKSKRALPKKDSLLIALKKGQVDRVARALDIAKDEDDPEINPDMDADSAQNSILHRAARYGHLNIVKMLLDRHADPNRKNKFGMSPLHHAAVAGDADVARQLVQSGGRADSADDAGRTALHWAAGHGFVDVVRVLLEENESRPAKADVADKEGWTPLHRCCQERPPEKKKKSDDEDPEDEKEKPDPKEDLLAQDRARAEIARLLLRHGADADRREPRGRQTALHLAAMNGYARTAVVLIEEGRADVDAVNKISQTPLIYAVVEGHAEAVRALLEHGRPDLSIGNELHFDWAPMHWAVLQDNVEILEILLEGGADIEIKDKVGRTPAKVADENYKENALKFLEKRMKQKGKKSSGSSGNGKSSGASRRDRR